MRIFAVTMMAGLAMASGCLAQAGGHVVSRRTVYMKPTYSVQTAVCRPGDGKTAEQWFAAADRDWGTAYNYGSADMYLCAARAAQAGLPRAQTLLGVMLTHIRTMPFGSPAQPMFDDQQTAAYWFRRAAEGGDGKGAFELGQLTELGMGVAQDDAAAADLYRKAIELGYGTAKTRLKLLETRAARIAAFEAKYLAKAQGGDNRAMLAIATAYTSGDPYVANDASAVVWLMRAAEAGNGAAQSRLGRMYCDGEGGVAIDEPAGQAWLLKAALSGVHDNDAMLTYRYDAGELAPDMAAQVRAASTAGKLRDWLGERISVGPEPGTAAEDTATGVAGDDLQRLSALSLADLTAAAEGGNPAAQFVLGMHYLENDSGKTDAAAARSWFEKSAMQMSASAMNLGDMAYSGQGGPVDMAAAARWYAVAAVMSDRLGAQNATAIYLREGGPAYDPVKAYAMVLSVQLTHPPARESRDNDALRLRLQAKVTPDQRTEALAWLCELMLQHKVTYVEVKP